jgi:hypothetical protein
MFWKIPTGLQWSKALQYVLVRADFVSNFCNSNALMPRVYLHNQINCKHKIKKRIQNVPNIFYQLIRAGGYKTHTVNNQLKIPLL